MYIFFPSPPHAPNTLEVHSGHFGLVITQTMGLMNRLQWGIRQSADLENQMTSVERILEYKTVTKEAGYESSLGKYVFLQKQFTIINKENHI